eukprot:gene4816-5063_t
MTPRSGFGSIAFGRVRLDRKPDPDRDPVKNTTSQQTVEVDAGFRPITSMELNELILSYSAGLKAHGLQQGDRVCLFAESSSRWLVADQGVLMCGAADAVRGSSSPVEELSFILSHSSSVALVLQDRATLLKLLPCSRQSLATVVYTSGTTGHPKGVVLSHGNLAYQVDHLDYFLQVAAGDASLSLLPPWHIYQRTVSYYLYHRGAREVFTSLKHFRDDLTTHPPDHFVCVPLVLDTLYNKVMVKLKSEATGIKRHIVSALLSASNAFIVARRLLQGRDLRYAVRPAGAASKLVALLTAALLAPVYALAQKLLFSKVRAALGIRKTVVSGGGSLAAHLDLFYEAVGLPVLNGWGLTETSPVLACRRSSANVRGSVGLPVPGTQLVVVNPNTHLPVPDGQPGLLLAAGPGVTSGYLDDAVATDKAFVDGWFDTGDLGWRAPAGVAGSHMAGHIVLTGESADGHNIEPQPIEDALQRSTYIKHVVLVGQDKRELGALVFPDEEVIRSPLSVESGTLTRTMKPRRQQIMQVYEHQVEQLLRKLRG